MTDADTGELIVELVNYDKIEEICVEGLGLSANAYLPTHWLNVEAVGSWCGQHVWWRPSEKKLRVVTEAEVLKLKQGEEPLAVGPEGYADPVRYGGPTPFQEAAAVNLEAIGQMSEMGPILLQLSDQLFDAYDKDRSGSFDEGEFLEFLTKGIDLKAAGCELEGDTYDAHIKQVRRQMLDAGACEGCAEHLMPNSELCMHRNHFRVWLTQSFTLYSPARLKLVADNWLAAAPQPGR